MEEITLTDGQFQILLNRTTQPQDYDSATAAMVDALHRARSRGHKWYTQMTVQDIATALDIFENHQRQAQTSASQTALRVFARDHPTAMQIYIDRRSQVDVPRETSQVPA